jgi:hypothetical protein
MSEITQASRAEEATYTVPTSGAFMQTEYVGVRMTVYPITEEQMHTVAFLNTGSAICFSAAGSFLFLAFGMMWDVSLIANEAAAASPPERKMLIALCLVIGAIATAAGVYTQIARRTLFHRIKTSAIRPTKPLC